MLLVAGLMQSQARAGVDGQHIHHNQARAGVERGSRDRVILWAGMGSIQVRLKLGSGLEARVLLHHKGSVQLRFHLGSSGE